MPLPAPDQLYASSNCHTSPGIRQDEHLLNPHVHTQRLGDKTPSHFQIIFIFINQQKAITIKNVEQAHTAADYVRAGLWVSNNVTRYKLSQG